MGEGNTLLIDDLWVKIGRTTILNGISAKVDAGETVGIIGPNGSGKTTLFNCISGFYPASQGSLRFKDTDVTRAPPYRRAKMGIGRVFQNFGVFREMTVLENIITSIESRQSLLKHLLPWSGAAAKNKKEAMHFLEDVGLHQKAKTKAGNLSGGQMRLLEIVRTLAFGAELFLLDEPTAGVSPKMKEEVARLIGKLQEMGRTVLIIEHDITFIQKFCDRIVVLDLGRVVLDGAPQKVREDPLLQEIYFGSDSQSG